MTQQQLTEAHGTPAQFSRAVWAAFIEFGGDPEKAIRDYENEWFAAGRKDEGTVDM